MSTLPTIIEYGIAIQIFHRDYVYSAEFLFDKTTSKHLNLVKKSSLQTSRTYYEIKTLISSLINKCNR